MRELVARWNAADELGTNSPVKRLSALANTFFRALAHATGERDPQERLALARPLHNALLEAIGFAQAPTRSRSADASQS